MCVLFPPTPWAFVAFVQIPSLSPFAHPTHTDAMFGKPALDARWKVAHHELGDVPVDFGEAGGLDATAMRPVGQERRESHQFHDLGWVQTCLFDSIDEQSCRLREEPTVGSQFTTVRYQFEAIGPGHSVAFDIPKLPPVQAVGRSLIVSVTFHMVSIPSYRRQVGHCPDRRQEIKLFLMWAECPGLEGLTESC